MEALSQKVLILGIDGMDPLQTQKYVKMGLMLILKKFLIGEQPDLICI